MTGFIAAAVVLALLAAAFLALPLLRARTNAGATPAPLAALLATLAVIATSAIVYARLGNRSWMQSAAGASNNASNQNIAALARHLEREPQDLAAWLELGQAYGAIGQYPLALRSYERANRLANGGNAAALAGMGEALLLGEDGAQAAQAPEFFERALQLDPRSPKALFYSAVSAYRDGRLDVARERFAAMLALSPPQNVRVALQKQIEDIDAKLHPKVDAASAIDLHVTLAPALSAKVPANASLFVFVRAPQGGAPLAVQRSAVKLPMDVELSAANAMLAGHAVQPGQRVSVVARISSSGSPLAQSGDLYGEISYVAGKSGVRSLQIDKLSP